ncbi:hypothetical protein V8C86DRAFT_2948982 [Haematococcus lacustris]
MQVRHHAACLLATLCLVAATSLASAAEALAAECRELGFTGESRCSDCQLLHGFVKLDSLLEECKRCCVQEEAVRYTSASLEVCPERLGLLPEIKHFIEGMTSQQKAKLKVRLRLGALPRLRLKTAEGVLESLRVDGWKRAAFADFLNDRVA